MTREMIENKMLKGFPWDGTELAAPLTLPGALLAPSYVEQAQIVKPANPPAGSMRFYPKSDGQYYKLDSAGTETIMGGLTKAQADALYDPLGIAASSMSTHLANADPHPQYLTAAEGDQRYALEPGGPTGGYLTKAAGDTYYVDMTGDTMSGSLLFSPTNTADIGDTTHRPRDLWLGRNAAIGDTLTVVGPTSLAATDFKGNVTFNTDNAYDIGASAASRPRVVFAAAGFVGPGAIPTGGTAGQALIKNDATNYNYSWGTAGMTQGSADGRYLQLTGGTLSGNLLFGGRTTERIAYRTGTPNVLGFESFTAQTTITGQTTVTLVGNAWYDGTNWNRITTTDPVGVINIANTGMAYYIAPAGTGAPAWVNKFSVGSDGKITTPGDINGRWLYTTDGSNGVVQATNGTLYFRSASTNYLFDSGGTVTIQNYLSLGLDLTVGRNTTLNGVVNMIQQNGYGIGSAAGAAAPFMIQAGGPSQGGGAAMIAFHRPGAYAAYFGLDTDNQWAVGGWSMGGARYILITDSQAQTLTSKTINSPQINTPTIASATHTGHLTMSGGYIFGSYINMTADVAAGKPAYVAGNNGDNYLRWWPIAAVGPPGSGATPISVSAYGGQSGQFNGVLCQVTLPRTGTYAIVFRGGGSGGGGRCSYSLNTGDGGSFDSGGDSGMDAGIGLHNVGSWGAGTVITVNVDLQDNNISGTLYAYFIPTPTYPG